MKKILVPCDFSKPSINAFRVALDIAAQSGGSVHLLNVVELPVLHDSMIMPVLNFEQELLDDLKSRAEGLMAKAIQKHNKKALHVSSVVLFGHVFDTLLEYIASNGIDLVVIGSHGSTGMREVLVGSNAEKVVRRSPVPVMVVKDYAKPKVKNIVFPNSLDSHSQEELITRVKSLQSFFKARLHVVWINTPFNFSSDAATLKRLEEFARKYKLRNYQLHIYNHADEEEGILEFTNVIKGDLIAMATHGRKGISHLVMGSLAEDVVNHTPGMVWTYALKRELTEA